VTSDAWDSHLSGDTGLLVIPSRKDGRCRFAAIDLDGKNYLSTASDLVEKIDRLKLRHRCPVTRSKSGGQHVWFLFDEPVDAGLARSALEVLASALKLSDYEVFPKQERIEDGKHGTGINMPYFGDARCGVKKTGAEQTLTEFLGLAEANRWSARDLEELRDRFGNTSKPGAYARRTLAQLAEELAGTAACRNDKLNASAFRMGTMVAREWISRSVVEQALWEACEKNGLAAEEHEKTKGTMAEAIAGGMRVPHEDLRYEKKGETYEAELVRVASIQPQEIDWLWKGRIARGKLTVFGGHPGASKSTVTIDIAARITTGGSWPCGEGKAPLGSIIMLTVEDEIGDTIRPRLDAAGADVNRVYVLKGMVETDGQGRRSFDLMTDIAHLESVTKKLGDVALIVIDPVTAYMGKPGKLDSYRVTDVRSLLMPLQEMASRLNVAVIAVNHLTKGGGSEALMRFLGSVGMVAAGRAAYLVVKDKDDHKRRLFLPAKNNIGDDVTGFAYRICEKPTGYDKPAYAIALDWEEDHVTTTADEALAAESTDGRKSEKLERAKEIIAEMLKDGPRPSKEVIERCAQKGISKKSTWNAKEKLGVKSRKDGWDHWEWYLPGSRPKQDDLHLKEDPGCPI
jgi:AAA domain/TOTE conflict system, Archaeo-Eukaryotic Primase domain